MNLYEYQAKEILRACGIRVPDGKVAENLEQVFEAARRLGYPVAVKAQVHAGGRGKAGGIRIVKNEAELQEAVAKILGMTLKGLTVRKVLVEQAVEIQKQFYAAVTVDRARRENVLMLSAEGGIDIEETARTSPGKIMVLPLDSVAGFERSIEAFVAPLDFPDSLRRPFIGILRTLFRVYLETDAQLVEINPLALAGDGGWTACDAKMVLDDNALFRHVELQGLKEEAEENELEREAHRRGLAYVKLSGNIGIVGNGAGLVMTTMDEVKRLGGRPANFLDIGGGARREVIQNALEMIYKDPEAEGIFVNVFGGITRCDEVARGMVQVLANAPRNIPVVVRLTGTQAEEGRKILEKSNLVPARTMDEGARQIVSLVNRL